jgi:hypothetical protein
MRKKNNVLLLVVLFLLISFTSCKKETNVPLISTYEKPAIEDETIAWIAPALMPYPVYKEWNEIQNENKHLYIRGAKPFMDAENADEFNQVASQIPQYEIDLLTQFAEEYHASFLQNQYASSNYGYNISYFDPSFISIPFTFLSNFGGSTPEDIVSILNYSFVQQQVLQNKALFKPYGSFLETISTICFNDLKRQFTEFPPTSSRDYIEFVASKYDIRLLEQGTSAENPANFQHICVVPDGIIVFFLSGNICKPGGGIWEVYVPYESIAPYCQIALQDNAYSDLTYPPDWDMYAGEGSFIIHYPETPKTSPNEYSSNLVSWISEEYNHGSTKIYVPVSFSSKTENNFQQATIEIEWHRSTPFTISDEIQPVSQKEEMIDGIAFTSFEYSDVAAGNIYESKRYIGQCVKMYYQITFTIHSMQLDNYDPGTVEAFNKREVYRAVNNVFRSFSFR